MWYRLFRAHPESVGESYLCHAGHALGYAGTFALCACFCLVHALVPGLFTDSASRRLRAMHAALDTRLNTVTQDLAQVSR